MWGIVANVISDRVLRTGARVWVERCNGDAECPVVRGLSKSGRQVRKYTHFKRLTNFRAAWVPEHQRDQISILYADKASASTSAEWLVAMWSGVRRFNRDGSVLLQPGISTNESFKRAALRDSGPQ